MSKKDKKPLILIALRSGGENGGPFNSHQRILDNLKSDKYDLKPFYFPRTKKILLPWNFIKIVREIRKQKPLAMQIVGLQTEGFVSLVVCKFAHVKTILAVHGSGLESCEVSNKKRKQTRILAIEKFTVKHSDYIFTVS